MPCEDASRSGENAGESLAESQPLSTDGMESGRISTNSEKDDQLSAAAAYCAQEVRQHDKCRYLTALLAPPEERAALFALFAFNIEIAKAGDVTSEAMLGEIRLTWWREAIDELCDGKPRDHLVIQALAEVLQRKSIDKSEFDALIKSRIQDLEDERFARTADLGRYAEESGGRLSLMAVEMLGRTDAATRDAAWDIGTAWALIGMMRSLGYHAGKRRLYLPTENLKSARLSCEDVYARRNSPALASIVSDVVQAAQESLSSARLRCPKPYRWAMPVLLLAPLASAYARRFKKAQYDPFTKEISLGEIWPPVLLGWHNLIRRF